MIKPMSFKFKTFLDAVHTLTFPTTCYRTLDIGASPCLDDLVSCIPISFSIM